MSTIGDAIDKSQTEFVDFETQTEEAAAAAVESEVIEPQRRFVIPAWVKSQTGPGDVDEYINHPMNFGHSLGFAQILRGLTGIVGELRYALLDIGLGLLQINKERKAKRVAVEVAASVAAEAAGH